MWHFEIERHLPSHTDQKPRGRLLPALAGKLCLRLEALPSKNRSPPPRKDNQTTRDRTFIGHPEANPISGYRCNARQVLGENGFTRVGQGYGAVDGVLTLPSTEG